MQRQLALICILFVTAACGDDADDNGNSVIPGTNGTSNNATSDNATTNNTTTNNTTANNATTNNTGGPGVGTAAELLTELPTGAQPADRPCEATSTVAIGAESFESLERYGYDDQGRLQIVDTFEDATWLSREVLRYQAGELFREISVNAEDELIDLVTTVSYDAGRPESVELAIPDMSGVLNPPVETVEYSYESDEAWTITTRDDEGNALETDINTWDPATLTFEQSFDDGSSSALTFGSAPPVGDLHRFQFIEPFALGAPIASGEADEDADGTPDTTISATYDGDQIQTYQLALDGGGMITIAFSYTCDS